MIKLKHIVGFTGVIITICGFTIDNADYFKFVYSIIAPSYTNAMIAYDKMYVRGFILREDDIGFKEISQMVKDTAFDDLRKEIPKLKITQIKNSKLGIS
jgi:hypothetical protein